MSQQIRKYTLYAPGITTLDLAPGFMILDVQTQKYDGESEHARVWVLEQYGDVKLVRYDILCVGTGDYLVDDPGTYIGTAQVDNYVWHFFMKKVEP